MDIRGIEVTNQLRSAIRAKLLELGVRYDEELPDYILVMVVNKKTRQQMNDDLRLFLEASTAPFVEWLHDQVLKKLQKVQIAKKKTIREFVPTVVVKQEEERKKRKNNISPTLEESSSIRQDKNAALPAKEEATSEDTSEKTSSSILTADEKSGRDDTAILREEPSIGRAENPGDSPIPNETTTETTTPGSTNFEDKIVENRLRTTRKIIESVATNSEDTIVESRSRIMKRVSKPEMNERCEKRPKETSRSEKSTMNEEEEKEEEKEEQEEEKEHEHEHVEDKASESMEKIDETEKLEKRLKSCVNRPRVTSVVSVKTRLGTLSPRKKFETHRSRFADTTARQVSRLDRDNDFSHPRGNSLRNDYPRSRDNPSRNRQAARIVDTKNRRSFDRTIEDKQRSARLIEHEKQPRNVEKSTTNVKDRLGTASKCVIGARRVPGDDTNVRNERNAIKNRLGPLKNRSKNMLRERDDFSIDDRSSKIRSNDLERILSEKEEEKERMEEEKEEEDEDDDDDDDRTIGQSVPLKSRIVAIKRPEIIEKRGRKNSNLSNDVSSNDPEEDDQEAVKSLASKVIVTPRPLKPLQPTQKRATQSLLLRAVAEANRSVVKQKNPEPVLSDEKPRLKRLRTPGNREIGKNLSVHLNATKRLVMEKIQVQLSTAEDDDINEAKQHASRPMNEDHMGVVMSLFQRSDDNQKFLVTLNGYNNNVIKEKNVSEEEEEEEQEEEEERSETEMIEEDYLAASDAPNISNDRNDSSPNNEDNNEEITEKLIINADGSSENENTESVERAIEDAPKCKRRKLSPIVYRRSRSKSPERVAVISPISLTGNDIFEKRSIPDVAQTNSSDKSRDKCRYWPNCTLGPKCAYYHPGVPCSAFPACKFGDKCAYKHPKCKFGLACTKLGCAFSHPKQQCKYHPFCTKPVCPFSHPASVPASDTTRAKFTWKRCD